MNKIFEEARKRLELEIEQRKEALLKMEAKLLPLLKIFDKEDVPVKTAHYGPYRNDITLEPEAKLTRSAFNRLMLHLRRKHGKKIRVARTIRDGYVDFRFSSPDSWSLLNISNGAGTCTVEKTNERTLSYKEYDDAVANGCSGLELR